MRRLLIGTALLLSLGGLAGTAAAKQPTLLHFKSPSGNINCYLGSIPGNFAECLVRNSSWPSSRPKPKSCTLDWDAHTASTDGRHVEVGSCRGDIGPLCIDQSGARCTTLAYGHSLTLERLRCTSSAAGVTCRSRFGKHHGFRIARRRVVTF
jgi:hypothetical protein